MLSCDEFSQNIDDYIDNSLPPEIELQMDNHFLTCDKCRAELEFSKKLRASLSELPKISVPLDFKDNLYKKIELENLEDEKIIPRKKYDWSEIYKSWKTYSALAVCMLLFVLVKLDVWDMATNISKPDNIQNPISIGAVNGNEQNISDKVEKPVASAEPVISNVEPSPKSKEIKSTPKVTSTPMIKPSPKAMQTPNSAIISTPTTQMPVVSPVENENIVVATPNITTTPKTDLIAMQGVTDTAVAPTPNPQNARSVNDDTKLTFSASSFSNSTNEGYDKTNVIVNKSDIDKVIAILGKYDVKKDGNMWIVKSDVFKEFLNQLSIQEIEYSKPIPTTSDILSFEIIER